MQTQRFAVFGFTILLLACNRTEPAAEAPAVPASAAPAAVAAPPPAPAEPTAAQDQAPSLSGFEGEIALQWTSAEAQKPAQAILAQVKGGKLRFGMPEGVQQGAMLGDKAYVVVNVADKKLFAVAEDKRQVMTIDLAAIGKQMEELSAGQPKPAAPPTPPKVDKTGRMDTVAGYRCEDWDVTSESGKSSVCVAEQSASFLALPTMSLPAKDEWARELVDGHHVPVRMISFDAAGKERTRLELIKVEAKPMDDALFAAPEGYKVIDFVAMMRTMASALGAMGQGPAGASSPPGAPGMPGAGKMPPNFQAMMEQMKAARAGAGAKGGEPPPNVKAMLEKMAARAKAAESAPSMKPATKPAAKP